VHLFPIACELVNRSDRRRWAEGRHRCTRSGVPLAEPVAHRAVAHRGGRGPDDAGCMQVHRIESALVYFSSYHKPWHTFKRQNRPAAKIFLHRGAVIETAKADARRPVNGPRNGLSASDPGINAGAIETPRAVNGPHGIGCNHGLSKRNGIAR
jgi:hypothetical protein